MKCKYACNSAEHTVARRGFLGTMATGFGAMAGGFGGALSPAAAAEVQQQQKRVLVFYLAGGVSQLETWDPKPGTDTGGPFRTIPTSVPGIHISELLPYTAKQMHHLMLVRGVNTAENDHGKGSYFMHTGRRQSPAGEYPHLGSLVAKMVAPEDSALPGYIHVTPGGGGNVGSSEAAFLGSRYASVTLGNGKPPQNTMRPESVSESSFQARNAFFRHASDRFAQGRRRAQTEAYTSTYDQAAALMQQRDVFDVSKEPEAEQERYGKHEFGQQCLLARRLLENGVTFVKVSHSNYDTHHENFNFHIEQLGEFDQTFATTINDLAERGMLESTLVVVMSEFGRTPRINHQFGRDHWGKAWSVAMGGCGLQAGGVVGKTNENGTEVVEREVHGGHLFHTYLRALGLDPLDQLTINGRELQIADPAAEAIEEVLA